MADLVDTDLGAYRVVSWLGRGGMGAVYEAVHRRIGKRVAIKVLREDLAEDPEIRARFVNEARAVNDIGHEHLVDVSDIAEGDDGGPTYLVMELLRGRVLRDVLRQQGSRLPPQRAVYIIDQVADALGAAHAAGIIHRDMKPENVFLTTRAGQRDFAVVMDFGVAKLSDSGGVKTSTGALLGTPYYMSPEQTESVGIDPRADIYALGVMLYEMLTGGVPFPGGSVAEVVRRLWTETPVPVRELSPEISPELEAAVMKGVRPGSRRPLRHHGRAAGCVTGGGPRCCARI